MSDIPLPQDAFRSHTVTDEDKYFAQREQEILEELRQSREARTSHERRCPCVECDGNVLTRVQHDNVEVDQCSKCKGTWLDAGEMELLSGRATRSSSGIGKFFRNLAGDYSV